VGLFVSDGRRYRLDPSTLRQGRDGALYCDVREDAMTAQLDRHAMMQLEDFLCEDDRGVYLQLGGRAVRPPVVADPLQRATPADKAASTRPAARTQKPAAR
jgi:hypothetical protein